MTAAAPAAPAVDPGDDVRARAEELRAARRPFVSATVVRAERPTSAKPGDRALVLEDGTLVGFVGGDCARSSVVAQALDALRRAEPVLLRITPEQTEGPAGEGAVTVHNPCLSGGTLEIFLEPVVSPPLLALHGDAPIARAVGRLAVALGFEVASAGEGAPAGAAAVLVASHGHEEVGVLAAALRAGVPYVGLVASRRRGAAVAAALDVTDEQRERLHTPAGLDIGARTPEEVALSILAEIVSLRRRADAPAQIRLSSAADAGTALDPVCGMTVAAVDASLHADVDGVRVWFCGSGCRQAFLADPASFAATR